MEAGEKKKASVMPGTDFEPREGKKGETKKEAVCFCAREVIIRPSVRPSVRRGELNARCTKRMTGRGREAEAFFSFLFFFNTFFYIISDLPHSIPFSTRERERKKGEKSMGLLDRWSWTGLPDSGI